jgi:hypothetical protein
MVCVKETGVRSQNNDDIHFLGRRVTQKDLALMREVVTACNGLSRAELANTVCELLGWKRLLGSLKSRECGEFLEKLESKGLLRLPEKRMGRPVGSRTEVPITERGEPGVPLVGSASAVGLIEFEPVRTEEDRRWFRELVGRYHYLGHAVPMGAHLRYLVFASEPEKAIIGCVQFSSAAWHLAPRDCWIGWDDATRVRKLRHVVNNSRFLLLPWVQVKNLASRVLSLAVRQVVADWQERYGVQPLLAETFVDPTRFFGTIYRAANWIELGMTSGRGRLDRLHKREGVAPKMVFVYPLIPDAVRQLRER